MICGQQNLEEGKPRDHYAIETNKYGSVDTSFKIWDKNIKSDTRVTWFGQLHDLVALMYLTPMLENRMYHWYMIICTSQLKTIKEIKLAQVKKITEHLVK